MRVKPSGLPTALLPLLLLCLSGCVHVKLRGSYRVEENSGYPLLVPDFAATHEAGDFQTANVVLQSGGRQGQADLGSGCMAEGSIFSLRPGIPTDRNHWTIKSLSVQGWNLRGGKVDTDEQWKGFAEGVALMKQRGCFPVEASVFSLQRAFAAAIPLPAGEVQSFLYSANADGFVNLAPGMEIEIEEIHAPRGGSDPAGPGAGRALYAHYSVAPSAGRGVVLRSNPDHPGPEQAAGGEGQLYPDLAESFASAPLMRLFFESLPEGGSKRNAMLLGAANMPDLEAATRLIEVQGNKACAGHEAGFVCVTFKDDAVSLLSKISINGHLTVCPFGTQLAILLEKLPRDKQSQALATVRVMRRLARGDYAEVHFARSMENARQVVLVPEDRVRWGHGSH